jgi:hypothetical protein
MELVESDVVMALYCKVNNPKEARQGVGVALLCKTKSMNQG